MIQTMDTKVAKAKVANGADEPRLNDAKMQHRHWKLNVSVRRHQVERITKKKSVFI